MRELPVTLWGLPVLLLGAGRISQAMQPRLRALGAEVTVAARRFPDHARSKGDKRKPGLRALTFCRFCGMINKTYYKMGEVYL